MIKVYFDNSRLESGHAIRGIGYYTKNLLEYLQKDDTVKLVENPQDADIVHFPYFDLFFDTLRPLKSKKNVVTIFDVIPLLYPKRYPPGVKGKINFFKQKQTLRNIDAVITISETSKKDIVRFLDVHAEKIHVTYLAAQLDFKKLSQGNWVGEIKEKYSLPEKYVLYVGDVNYNKNLISLADACKETKIPLVVVGKQATDTNIDHAHIENRSFIQFLEKYAHDQEILRLGYVSTEDLVKIYNLANVYCQPSFYEGFGLPVLEAMSCGSPVVIAKTQALVELAEDCALYFSPYKIADMADKIQVILTNKQLRGKLTKRGLIRSRRFAWEKVAWETISIYQQLLGK